MTFELALMVSFLLFLVAVVAFKAGERRERKKGEFILHCLAASMEWEREQQEEGSGNGDIIPENERWLHEPAMKEQLARADKWMNANPAKETNLGKPEAKFVLPEQQKEGSENGN